MKIYPVCYPCFVKQAVEIAEVVRADDDLTKKIIHETMKFLYDNADVYITPPILVGNLYRHIHSTFFSHIERFDPFLEIKNETNDAAMGRYKDLQGVVSRAQDPIDAALKIAAAGNIIDFGALKGSQIDIQHEIDTIENLKFHLSDMDQLKENFRTASSILYICDNAGEIVFDKILLETLRSVYPHISIDAAVRGFPIINDAVLSDAKRIGLDKVVNVIESGSFYPGTLIKNSTAEFRKKFDESDIVISKGQGNFETLHDSSRKNLYFILRIKCQCIADIINAPLGAPILLDISSIQSIEKEISKSQFV